MRGKIYVFSTCATSSVRPCFVFLVKPRIRDLAFKSFVRILITIHSIYIRKWVVDYQNYLRLDNENCIARTYKSRTTSSFPLPAPYHEWSPLLICMPTYMPKIRVTCQFQERDGRNNIIRRLQLTKDITGWKAPIYPLPNDDEEIKRLNDIQFGCRLLAAM